MDEYKWEKIGDPVLHIELRHYKRKLETGLTAC